MDASPTPPPPPAVGAPGRRFAELRTARRRLLADKIARWSVTAGGFSIIASILGILIFILVEVAPLGGGASVAEGPQAPIASAAPDALLCDEYRTHAAVLGRDGLVRVFRIVDGEQVFFLDLFPAVDEDAKIRPRLTGVHAAPGQPLLAAASSDGRVLAIPVDWEISFIGRDRQVAPRILDPVVVSIDPEAAPLGAFAVRIDEEGGATVVAQRADGTLGLARREVEENLFTGEQTETWERSSASAPGPLISLVMDGEQRNLYGALGGGELVWWPLDEGRLGEAQVVSPDRPPVTALSMLLGDRGLLVGRADGALEVWFTVRQPDESFVLTPIRDFPSRGSAIRLISPSRRNRGFIALSDDDRMGLYYSTSLRVLWNGAAPLRGVTALYYAPKADGAILAADGRLAGLDIDNPHPEMSLRALFGKVWYEGYTKPAHVWQSTGISDEFESKLSLTPLMIGTLKGTFYSLFLAIPLGVLGAMYTSQFMHGRLKRYIKPTVEIMAALPSVVLGFLAGLWLAPRVEQILPGLFLMLLVVPVLVVLSGFLWQMVPLPVRSRFIAGSETLIYAVAVTVGVWFCLWASTRVENLLFAGSIQDWLLSVTGLKYDQRNAVVVGLAMGFAVIPIIFSIAEDAFSNVPRNLVSGSLALGANRWQTVTRVVFPSASPGIFSAIMIGFGRAVGETMIVLMATGNTPVMDWNPFNGFRTLSANIAVEIPEAPLASTLYRTLFLAALLLFIFTFAINTAAELVRQRLRKRYAEM